MLVLLWECGLVSKWWPPKPIEQNKSLASFVLHFKTSPTIVKKLPSTVQPPLVSTETSSHKKDTPEDLPLPEAAMLNLQVLHGCGSKPMGSDFWGSCTTHFRTYFSGDWDVHWGDDLDFDPWPHVDFLWSPSMGLADRTHWDVSRLRRQVLQARTPFLQSGFL